MITDTSPATRAVDVVNDFFGSALDSLADWCDELAADLAAVPIGRLTASGLDDMVRPYAARTLADARTPAYGAGFVAATDLLPGVGQHLSWWQGPDGELLTQASRTFNTWQLDYSEFEWFRVPLLTGRPHIAGPGVDYLCCEEYTMTVAIPVLIGGRFAGIAGLDLLVDSIERRLIPLLRGEGSAITLINEFDRVILSTDLRLETGASIYRSPSDDYAHRHRCGNLPLAVVTH